jgi:type IV secretory pathway VirB10-like protein
VNIPPTVDIAQGARVGVFVSRDLYFGDVYQLRQKPGRP